MGWQLERYYLQALCSAVSRDEEGDERLGRVVHSFSYAQNSVIDYMIRRLKDKKENVSHVICEILENHHDLYETSRQQTEEIQKLARLLHCHTQAAKTSGLTLVNNPYALGWHYKEAIIVEEEE